MTMPHPLRTGESATLEVRVGPIPRGEQIRVTTAAGKQLGVLAPYGLRAGQEAGTFTVPLPPAAIHGDRVAVKLTITPLRAHRARRRRRRCAPSTWSSPACRAKATGQYGKTSKRPVRASSRVRATRARRPREAKTRTR